MHGFIRGFEMREQCDTRGRAQRSAPTQIFVSRGP